MKRTQHICYQYRILALLGFTMLMATPVFSQKYEGQLYKADRYFIKRSYNKSVDVYEKYLLKHPKDFYASRQAALCYTALNDPNRAIDHWPNVVDNSAASDEDQLAYAKCLLENSRDKDAMQVFMQLRNSRDPKVAEQVKIYLEPQGKN